MGLLRDVLERSAESARQLRTRLAVASSSAPSTSTPIATPSNETPAEDDDEALRTPQQEQRQPTKAPPPPSKPKAVSRHTAARLTQLVGENPPPGSLARVVKRKYQSVARERERIEMVAAMNSSSSSGSSSKSRSTGAFGSKASSSSDAAVDSALLDAVEQYEVEFPKLPDTSLGIELETDFYGKHTVIKHVRRGSVASVLATSTPGVLRPGHVVVGLNGRDLSDLSFEHVLCALKDAAGALRVIRFVDPSVLPMKLYRFERTLVNRDQYGFAKDDTYMRSYRKQLRKRKSLVRACVLLGLCSRSCCRAHVRLCVYGWRHRATRTRRSGQTLSRASVASTHSTTASTARVMTLEHRLMTTQSCKSCVYVKRTALVATLASDPII